MIITCLMDSLTKEVPTKEMEWKDNSTIGECPSAILLLKVIIPKINLDLNATTASIRTKLTQLVLYLPTVGHGTTKLNVCVSLLLDSLAA